MHVYCAALRASGRGHLIDRYDLLYRDYAGLRQLSEYAKKKGQTADIDWRYLVDLHRLQDYMEPKGVEDFRDDIQDWVQRQPLHQWDGDELKWLQKFREHFIKVIDSGVTPDPSQLFDVDTFVTNGDIWCTSGSGFEPENIKLEVYDIDRQEMVKAKKTKWSVRWKASKYDIKRLLWKRRKQVCKAVPKSEPAKVRAVISSDLALYLKMSFLSQWFDKYFKGDKRSTLWMSKKDAFAMWQGMSYDGTWRMPIDQSEFDKNVNIKQIDIMMEELQNLLKRRGAPAEFIEVMGLVRYALQGGYVIVGDAKIAIMNGILSGWRWTAFLDTLVNLTEMSMSQDWIEEKGYKSGLISVNAQGDDDLTKFKSRADAIATWMAYTSFGLDVNPGKFFLDRRRDEYLRRVYENGKLTGYPARSVTSICFRNPVNERESPGSERVRQTLKKWKLFSERMDTEFAHSFFERSWRRDCLQGTNGMTNKILTNWLYQSPLQGGIGYDNKGEFFSTVPGPSILEVDRFIITTPGFLEWVKFAEQYGVASRECEKFAASTLDINTVSRFPSWVRYIYTYDDLGELHLPYGLKTGQSGTICIGKKSKTYARNNRLRWFKSLSFAKHATQYKSWEMVEVPVPADLKYTKLYKDIRPIRFNLRPGITKTLANLSNQPDLVYYDYNPELLKHKPKRWQMDFLNGRLKTKIPELSGWGTDIVGAIADRYLGDAINRFLRVSRPSYDLWESFLASINKLVINDLATLEVRVIE